MQPLTPGDLYSLEEYHEERPGFRERVLEHKRDRKVALGPNATLLFEDRLTIQYQVQEMLRIERIFEADAIAEELEAYNPLIPDGGNLKATFMIEYPDVDERRRALEKLVGIERTVYAQVEGFEPVFAIADEDMDRTAPGKTSAVHFLRLELTPPMIAALKQGAPLTLGVEHAQYTYRLDLPTKTRDSLVADLD